MLYRCHAINGHYEVMGWGKVVSRHDNQQAAIRLAEQLNRAMGLTSDGHETERLERKQGTESLASEWAWWRSD